MMEPENKKWLFGTIREINTHHEKTYAAVAKDTDDDHALCIAIGPNLKNIEFATHFNINWLEDDPVHVDWLAGVVGGNLRNAYAKGRSDMRKEILRYLGGLKELLGL